MDFIETKNITKTFKKSLVLSDVNLNIPKNATYGLFGPNGTGKTTLIKILAGVLFPDSGEVLYNGENTVDGMTIGALIDAPALYPNLTAYENLRIRALLYDLPNGRIEEVMNLVKLTKSNKTPVKKYSLGMKQRLGIAISIINSPDFLILDEPTNGLDPLGIRELFDLISQLKSEGTTTLVSSHSLKEVEEIVTHIGILSEGTIIYQDEFQAGMDLKEIFMSTISR